MNTKISLSELTDQLSRKSDSTKKEAEQFLKEFFSLLSDTLAQGESLKINGLGQFRPIWVDARTSVNVHTGEPMEIPGHYKLSFTPDKSMREAVNAPFSAFVPEVLPDDVILDMPEESDASDDEPEDEMPSQPAPENKPVEAPAPAEQPAADPSVTKLSEKELDALSDLVIEKLKTTEQQQQKAEEKTKSATAETPVVTARVDVSEPAETPVEEPEAPKEETPVATPTLTVENEDEDESDDDDSAETLWEKICRRPVLSTLCAVLVVLLLLTCSAAWQLQRQGISMRDVWTYYFPSEPSAGDESQPTLPLPENNSGESLVSTPETTSPADDVDVTKLPPVATERMGKGSRLTLLALKYYGHKDFWVYIYEENKTLISNPNRIPVGFDLAIPDARKYGIDANDEASLQKAQDLALRLKEKYE